MIGGLRLPFTTSSNASPAQGFPLAMRGPRPLIVPLAPTAGGPLVVIVALYAIVWLPAASSTISSSECWPALSRLVLSVRLPLTALLHGCACSKERWPSRVRFRDWHAPPLLSRICETAVWPSTRSEPPYTPD